MDEAEKAKLGKQCASVRAELKAWEAEYAQAHEGKKPSREVIKANPEIAAKYKRYSSLRDTLAGKKPKQVSKPPAPKPQLPAASPVKQRQTNIFVTPSKDRVQNFRTPTTTRTAQQTFQTPSAGRGESPYVPRIIGPTPQRDGRVLGLFDLIDDADGDADSKSPSKVGFAATSTPQKRRLDDTEEDGLFARNRTPMSASKRQLLDSFLTPTKKTLDASSSSVHGATPKSVSKDFATPAFLKRRAAPAAYVQSSDFASPGRPPRMGRPQFSKGLSSLVASLRKVEEQAYEDDEEALRDMEMAAGGGFQDLPPRRPLQPLVVPVDDKHEVEDSQAGVRLLGGFDDESQFDEQVPEDTDRGRPMRQFKKRMPKRTTRKVNIKPTVYARPADAALPEDDIVGATADSNGDEDEAIPETQLLPSDRPSEDDGDEYQDENEPPRPKFATATAAAAAALEAARKDGTAVAPRKVNEMAHANFKRLKLRNFGAKGGPGYNSRFRRRR
ncbi:hypothetical protein TD95_003714 [Thielaviopsis punctulata]|uniref:DNA replication regulator SLD2 n=1 Tax=Thielaviopsis punctulata TaxID=72032 RepID=A0A0F4ZG57_9PEZI|nr:hypothetical protein TD95_003714 [Thielaviopsis punctulata]